MSVFQTLINIMNIKDGLTRFGLDEKEAKIYIELLKDTERTAFQLSKESGIPRTTVYSLLESLKHQGLISSFKKNNVTYFVAENSTRFNQILKEKEKIVQEIMPQIQALTYSNISKPLVKLYMGIDGMKIVLEDILETLKKEKIRTLYATAHPGLIEFFPKYFPEWLKRREQMNVTTKLIINETENKDILKYFPSNSLRETCFLPKAFPFDCTIDIYGNKIAFFSLKEDQLYAVIVESPTITNMFRQFFLFTWEMINTKK